MTIARSIFSLSLCLTHIAAHAGADTSSEAKSQSQTSESVSAREFDIKNPLFKVILENLYEEQRSLQYDLRELEHSKRIKKDGTSNYRVYTEALRNLRTLPEVIERTRLEKIAPLHEALKAAGAANPAALTTIRNWLIEKDDEPMNPGAASRAGLVDSLLIDDEHLALLPLRTFNELSIACGYHPATLEPRANAVVANALITVYRKVRKEFFGIFQQEIKDPDIKVNTKQFKKDYQALLKSVQRYPDKLPSVKAALTEFSRSIPVVDIHGNQTTIGVETFHKLIRPLLSELRKLELAQEAAYSSSASEP